MDQPDAVRREFGYSLYVLQCGEMPPNASSVETFNSRDVMKLTERFDTDTYRCVYAAKLPGAIYILHVFKKKSTSGIATPKRELDTIRTRFVRALELHAAEFGDQKRTDNE
jgi:phage-related protein